MQILSVQGHLSDDLTRPSPNSEQVKCLACAGDLVMAGKKNGSVTVWQMVVEWEEG